MLPFNLMIHNPIRELLRSPLYKSSIYILLNYISTSLFGFLFWIVAARYYPTDSVGVATSLISIVTLIVALSKFGLDQSLIRFFPEYDKGKIFVTSAFVMSAGVLIFGIVFLFGVDTLTPHLTCVRDFPVPFLIFLFANSLTTLIGISFIALKETRVFFIQSLLIGTRLILLIPLISYGAFGIFQSFGLSFVVTLLISFVILSRFDLRMSPVIDVQYLRISFNYSTSNYVSSIFLNAPNQILPILVLNLLGAKESAIYFITFSIATLLFMVPYATSTALFVEGSHGGALRKATTSTIIITVATLSLGILGFYLFGSEILGFIGRDYLPGYKLLLIFALSSIFTAVSHIFISVRKIQRNTSSIVFFSILSFGIIIVLSYIFVIHFGILGIGISWLLGYVLLDIIIAYVMLKENWFSVPPIFFIRGKQ